MPGELKSIHLPPAGTRVGLMIGFVPVAVPPSGYPMDYKLPLAEVPAWAVDAGFGFAFDRDFGAIAIRIPDDRRPQPGPPVRPTNTVAFALRGTVARDNVELLAKSLVGRPGFLGLFSDPHLVSDTDPGTCPVAPVGNSDYVVTQTGRAPSESPNDVLLAIVDLGFDKDIVIANAPQTQFEPALSYTAPNASGTPGSAPGDEHGNMCAYDATLVANNATLVDIRAGDPKDLRLSDATEAYDVLYAKITSDPTLKTKYRGLVLSNSWGIWAKDDNLPLGSVDRYFDNPNHPFTVMVRNLVALGADVVFAAGDSGECRSTSNNGTIWGANSLDEVISVAAVDVDKARTPYSSQGPGVLAATKPDVSGYAEFTGSDDGDTDTATSAAAAIVAGVVVAIRSQNGWSWRDKTPAEVKQRVISTADKDVVDQTGSPVTLTGWTRDFGYGVARLQ